MPRRYIRRNESGGASCRPARGIRGQGAARLQVKRASRWRRCGDGGCRLFPERRGNRRTRALSCASIAITFRRSFRNELWTQKTFAPEHHKFVRTRLGTMRKAPRRDVAAPSHTDAFAGTKSQPARGYLVDTLHDRIAGVWSGSILQNVGPRFVRTTNWLSET